MKTYLTGHASCHDFTHGLLAVAGPIAQGRATLTNTPWLVDTRELKSSFGFEVQIINDFQAVAYSLQQYVR